MIPAVLPVPPWEQPYHTAAEEREIDRRCEELAGKSFDAAEVCHWLCDEFGLDLNTTAISVIVSAIFDNATGVASADLAKEVQRMRDQYIAHSREHYRTQAVDDLQSEGRLP